VALSQTKLADQLVHLVPVGSEAEAIAHLATAWETYFSDATVALAPTTPGALAGAMSAFKGALVGLNLPNAGATKIQAAIQAFWSALELSASAVWIVPGGVVAPGAPPTTTSQVATRLAAQFLENVTKASDLPSAAQAVAAVLHGNGGLGGTVSVAIAPGAPSPVPVL